MRCNFLARPELHPVVTTGNAYGGNVYAMRNTTPHPFKTPPLRLFLKQWRQHRDKMSQQRLAEIIGSTKATISRIENGKQNWDQEFLQLAAEALRCEPPDLLMRDPTRPDALWSLVDSIKSEPVRQKAADYIQGLKDGTGG